MKWTCCLFFVLWAGVASAEVLPYASAQKSPPAGMEWDLPETPSDPAVRVIDLQFSPGGSDMSNSLFIAYALDTGVGWSLPPLASGTTPNSRCGYVIRYIRHGDGSNEVKFYRNDEGWFTELKNDWTLPANPVSALRRTVIRHGSSGEHQIEATFDTGAPFKKMFVFQDAAYPPGNPHRRMQVIAKGHTDMYLKSQLRIQLDTWTVVDLSGPINPLPRRGRGEGEGVLSKAPALEKKLYKELDMRKKKYGPRHPKVAESLNQLARLLEAKDRDKSKRLYQQALVLLENRPETALPELIVSLNGLAAIDYGEERYASAEKTYRRMIGVMESPGGSDHPDLVGVLNKLALIYFHHLNRKTDAEPLYKRSVAITEKTKGRHHPDLASPLLSLAEICLSQKRYPEAEEHYTRVLSIQEKAMGPGHSEVSKILHKLGQVYRQTGRPSRAELVYKQALAIEENTWGPGHPMVAASLNNLANVYVDLGWYEDADTLYKRSVAIIEKELGPSHPRLAPILENVAVLYQKMGRPVDAQPYESRAKQIRGK